MTQEVNFEIAKLLEERGFSEKTLQAYVYRGVEHQDPSYKGRLTKDKLLCDIPAPTIAEVRMWLYDNYGIWISVDIGMTGFYGHYKVNPQNTLPSNLKQGWVNSQDNPAKSITEAYEAVIKYTLENLIQKGNK